MSGKKVAEVIKKKLWSLWNYKHFGRITVARIRDSKKLVQGSFNGLVAVTRKVQGVMKLPLRL